MAFTPKQAADTLQKAQKYIANQGKKTLEELAGGDRATHVAEVVHHGAQLTVPEGMTIPQAIMLLLEREEYLQKEVQLQQTFDVFPLDGALALEIVLRNRYGWSQATGTPNWFGETPPSLIDVQTSPDTYVKAPWGSFKLPGVEGLIKTGVDFNSNRYRFKLSAVIKRQDEATVNAIFKAVQEHLRENSIYRGQAIKIKFRDDDGASLPMPEPSFIDTRSINAKQLILSQHVHDAIATNLFTPISRVDDLIANGIPIKRGVLLGGTYGTGKTLAAFVAAKHAVDAGITYLYIPRAKELAEAIEFAKQYQSPACVIFCEDIDRTMSGERDESIDEVLNLIDGIDTKNANIIIVLTTNDLKAIEPAMLRPGRLDAVIEVTPPDAEAVEQLLRYYGGDAIEASTDLTQSGVLMEGHIPAIVNEVVKRAKLDQVRLSAPGTKVVNLSAEALAAASHNMSSQMQLLKDRTAPKEVPTDTLEGLMSAAVLSALAPKLAEVVAAVHLDTKKQIEKLKQAIS